MDIFELFDIPVSLIIDTTVLKKKYFKLSRKFHPDLFINETTEIQDEALAKTSEINNAYNILKDKYNRIEYILKSTKILGKSQQLLDPDFLMEMMDINEELASLDDNFKSDLYDLNNNKVLALELNLEKNIQEILNQQEIDIQNVDLLNKLKGFYLKMKYIMRIKEKLLTFAIQ